MSLIFLVLWWGIATSLGIAAIILLEPLWTPSRAESPVDEPRRTRVRSPRPDQRR